MRRRKMSPSACVQNVALGWPSALYNCLCRNSSFFNRLFNNVSWSANNKKSVEGQLDMYNYKLAEIAHEIDKIDLNQVTPIDALNILIKIKNKMK